MIFHADVFVRLAEVVDQTGTACFTISQGLWLLCLSSGRAAVSGDGFDGFFLSAGQLLLCPTAATLAPTEPVHLVGIRLCGSAADAASRGAGRPLVQNAHALPGIAETIADFAANGTDAVHCFALLERLAQFDASVPFSSRLAAQAVHAIRENYASLYGVEELAEQLCVTKSHLVRSFKTATGSTPGQYLTAVRVEAAKQLLGSTDYALDLIAQLAGFSGANYFCRVFREKTGRSPAAYRAACANGSAPGTDLVSGEIFL